MDMHWHLHTHILKKYTRVYRHAQDTFTYEHGHVHILHTTHAHVHTHRLAMSNRVVRASTWVRNRREPLIVMHGRRATTEQTRMAIGRVGAIPPGTPGLDAPTRRFTSRLFPGCDTACGPKAGWRLAVGSPLGALIHTRLGTRCSPTVLLCVHETWT